MLPSTITASLLLAAIGGVAGSPFDLWERTTENGQCTGANNALGVCVSTSSCTEAGGSYISNACPDQPDNIKCCTKSSCGSGGSCKWTSKCASGNTVGGLCPGPSDFKCCLPASSSSGDGGSSSSSNLGEKILAKAKTAKGDPCMKCSTATIYSTYADDLQTFGVAEAAPDLPAAASTARGLYLGPSAP